MGFQGIMDDEENPEIVFSDLTMQDVGEDIDLEDDPEDGEEEEDVEGFGTGDDA